MGAKVIQKDRETMLIMTIILLQFAHNVHFGIFLGIFFNMFACCHAETALERKKRENNANIKRVEWLKSVESNKLYKNQQKLENATTNLKQSQSEVVVAEREL